MRRADIAIMGILAVGLYMASGWISPRKPLPPDLLKSGPPTKADKQKSKLAIEVIDLPGPGGARISARFYGLERLPPAGHDMCKQLSARRAAIVPSPSASDSERDSGLIAIADTLLKRACLDALGEEAASIQSFQRGSHAVEAAAALASLDGKAVMDEDFASAFVQAMLADLRKIKTIEDLHVIIRGAQYLNNVGVSPGNLVFKRIYADIQRLRADLCAAQDDFPCRATHLAYVGRDYARLGRLEDDEQHFSDMAAALDEAEKAVLQISDKSTRVDLLDEIAGAFGYGGEAGRDRNLLMRATDISRRIVKELEAGKDGEDKYDYSNAIDSLAANLGRLGPVAADRIAITREAIDVGEQAVAHSGKHFPGDVSWAAFINLAASQRELFELTGEHDLLDRSIANARRALVNLDSRNRGNLPARDYNVAYVHTILGFSLAARARSRALHDNEDSAKQFKEARELLDAAEPIFRSINAQAYLRILARARLLLAEDK